MPVNYIFLGGILVFMPKCLAGITMLSRALKFRDLVTFLIRLDRTPLYYKEAVEVFNKDEKRFSSRMKLIKHWKIIDKKPITYEDTGKVGTQYRLTKKGKTLVKKLREIDDFLRS